MKNAFITEANCKCSYYTKSIFRNIAQVGEHTEKLRQVKRDVHPERKDVGVPSGEEGHRKVSQSCLTLQLHRLAARQAPLSMGILQARTLEWVAMPSSRGSSQPRD